MATGKITKILPPLDQRIEATIMALREAIMNYYKGTCVEELTYNSNITFQHVSTPRLPYQYQREAQSQRSTLMLGLGGCYLARLQKSPDCLTFQTGVLKSSPGLERVGRGLEQFLDNYLSAVEVKHSKETDRLTVNDEKLFTAQVKDFQKRPESLPEEILEYINASVQPRPIQWSVDYSFIRGVNLTDDTPF